MTDKEEGSWREKGDSRNLKRTGEGKGKSGKELKQQLTPQLQLLQSQQDRLQSQQQQAQFLQQTILLLSDNEFWISGNTPSSKNGQRVMNDNVVASEDVIQWKRKTEDEWLAQRIWFNYIAEMLSKPLYIELTFIRRFKDKPFDYINMAQIIQDSMVKYGWVKEDNFKIIHPYFGTYLYDPTNPGVYIRVLSEKPLLQGEQEFRAKIEANHKQPDKKPRKKKTK